MSTSGAIVLEQLLHESAEELYEFGPCGYLSTAPDGAILTANHTFLAWTGYTREAVVGRRLQALLTAPGAIFYDTHFAPLLRMQGFANELAFDLVRADGTQLPVLLNSSLKKNANGDPLLIAIAVFDATDRRAYERELLQARRSAERALKDRSNLLSMISHDVRTPVSAMVMALQLLERIEATPQQQKPLRILRTASSHLLDLLNEVLDFSQIDAGTATLVEKPFDLRHSLEGLLLTLEPRAQERGLRLCSAIDPGMPPEVVGDEPKIGQVVSNLMINAMKFTEAGEVRLCVTVREQGADVVTLGFDISDTGIGIPQARLPYIFDEFTQGSDETRHKYGGAGLGLTICKRLLALLGSEIHVTSREREGSNFLFDLRLRTPGATLPDVSLGNSR
ncbi:MAG TPA: HAMP domain-containing sensor histidine kinase [Rhodanobacteraceae bacterium]|nr:HAMP domain-containing sensor histidine kinase [Rhodanobacteraceae bacterium]